MVWVLEDCPNLPPHLVAPLMGLANHADQNGRGAYCSTSTVAWYTRKGRDASRDDLDKLVELGLIRRGDQRMALHLPAGDRPVVYDLCMELRRAPRPDRPRGGRPRKPQATTPLETGGVSTPPQLFDEKPGGSTAETGGVCGPNWGGLQTPRTVLEPSLNQNPPRELTRPDAARAPRPRTGGDEMDHPTPETPTLGEAETTTAAVIRVAGELYDQHRWSRPPTIRAIETAMLTGHTWPEIQLVLARIATEPTTRGPGRLNAAGLPAHYWTDARNQLKPPAPAWCGQCDSRTRHVVDPTTSADLGRCHRCHYSMTSA